MKTETLIDELSQNLRPVRPPLGPGALSFVWTGIAVTLVLTFALLFFGLRADFSVIINSASFLLTSSALLGAFVTSSHLAFLLMLPGRAMSPRHFLLPSVFLLSFNVSLMLIPMPIGETLTDGFSLNGIRCSAALASLAFIPGLLIFYFGRRLACIDAGRTAKAIGLAVGAIGALGISLHCPSQHGAHLFLYHGLPVLILGLGLRAVGKLFLRW